MLQRAYQSIIISPGSSSNVFAMGRPKDNASLRLKRCSRKWTKMIYAPETRRAQFSRPPLHASDFRCARIIRAINELSEPQLCWIKHLYMPRGHAAMEFGKRFAVFFWHEYLASAKPSPRLDHVVLQRMANLVVFAPVDFRIFHTLEYEPLWQIFGIGKSNWHKRYSMQLMNMKRIIWLHHNRSLMSVLNKL